MDPLLSLNIVKSIFDFTANPATILSNVAEVLVERANNAKTKYEISSSSDPIEQQRYECLQRICELQQRVILDCPDTNLVQRVLPLLIELITNTYEAINKRQLDMISMSLSRISDTIKSFETEQDYRNRIRAIAVFICILCFIGLGYFLYWGKENSITSDYQLPILNLPILVVVWSAIGSFAAILYRFNNAADNNLDDPLRWLFARPLTGIIVGSISFIIIRLGLMAIDPNIVAMTSKNTLGNNELIWLLAFMIGFSDRFTDSVLRSLVGKMGGEKDGELISMQVSSHIKRGQAVGFHLIDNLKNFASKNSLLSVPFQKTVSLDEINFLEKNNGKPNGADSTKNVNSLVSEEVKSDVIVSSNSNS